MAKGFFGGGTDSKALSWTKYLRGLEHHVNWTFGNTAEVGTDYVKMFFKMESEKRWDTIGRIYSGLLDPEPWAGEGQPIPSSGYEPRFGFYYESTAYANGFKISYIAEEFDEYGIYKNASSELGHTFFRLRQKQAAGFWANGFTSYWNAEAAEYLFSASHALSPRYAGGNALGSNLVVGGPSVGAYSDAVTLMLNTPDDLGNPLTYTPKYLVCHPKHLVEWESILGPSPYRPDTANHTPNAIKKHQAEPMAWEYLPDEDMWFLTSNKNPLVWNDTRPLKTRSKDGGETWTSFVGAAMIYYMYAMGWRGIVGSEG